MKTAITAIVIFVILTGVCWLSFGFYTVNYNMNTWNQEIRGAYIFMQISIFVLSPLIAGLIRTADWND